MIQEFHYRIHWSSRNVRPGHHPSIQSGGGFEFCGYKSLHANADARHIDIRASLNDPFEQFVVRRFRQYSSVPIFVIADLSASMGFGSLRNKIELLADFSTSAAYSAYRTGDPFGFIGCNRKILWNLFLALGQYRGSAIEHLKKVRQFTPIENGMLGMLDAVQYLGKKRALVFLVSDFHFPFPVINSLMDAYSPHDIVPVVVWDSAEFEDLPSRGFVRVKDAETGSERTLLMRPELHLKIKKAFQKRHNRLVEICSRYGREPFFILNKFLPDKLTEYFAYK